MKIASLEPMTCDSGVAGRDWLFLKVTTDEGLVGWGEGYDSRAAPALAEAIRLVGAEAIGQDPRRIDFISRRLWDSGRAGFPERLKVIAALDLALYDIKAKSLGVPVYDLIGGLYRDRIPLYWSQAAIDGTAAEAGGHGPVRTLDDWLALADAVGRAGFRALKFDLSITGSVAGLSPTLDGAIDAAHVRAAVDFVGAVRERCGPDIGIMLDAGRELRMGGILQLARALEPFDLYWLEADGFDPGALLAAREQTRTRIAHGKALVGRQAFRPFLERHVTDVIAVETLSTGLSEARRIAELAAHYDAMVSPANHMGPLSSLIGAHLGAVMPNVEIMELHGADVPWKWQLVDHPPRIEQGELVVPDRPGWGADILQEEVARHLLRDPAHTGLSRSRRE